MQQSVSNGKVLIYLYFTITTNLNDYIVKKYNMDYKF